MKRNLFIRVLSFVLCLTLFTSVFSFSAAEDSEDESVSDEELAELLQMEEEADEDGPQSVLGRVFVEPDRTEFNANSPALYRAKLESNTSILSERNQQTGKKLCYNTKSVYVDVLYVGLVWVVVRYEKHIGYVKRPRVIYNSIEPVDPVNTPPFGLQIQNYIATVGEDCSVRHSMSDDDAAFVTLHKGARITLWRIIDGWGIVTYMRNYGYINMNNLENLIPISHTDTPLSADTPIAAYTSYYKMDKTDSNKNRIFNIRHGAELVSRTLQPGGKFNFNADIGPFNRTGFKKATVLVDGKAKPGYGGGTCQVSSTLYNCLKILPGITINQRRPHGPGGASYLPIFCDAAVGNDSLNLRFTNSYSFPIRIEGYSQDDGALFFAIYRAD